MGKPEWTRGDTDDLLKAWEKAVPPPRARELTPAELEKVFGLIRAFPWRPRISAAAVRLMIRQVVTTYHFITEFDERSRRLGSATSWFEMPQADRVKCTDSLPADSPVMKFVSRDFFQKIARICSNGTPIGSEHLAGHRGATDDEQGAPSEHQVSTEDSERGSDSGTTHEGDMLGSRTNAQTPSPYGDEVPGARTMGDRSSTRAENTSGELASSGGSWQESPSRGATQGQDGSGTNAQRRHVWLSSAAAAAEVGEGGARYDNATSNDAAHSAYRSDISEFDDGDDGTAETASPFPGPFGDWSKHDFLQFLQSWSEAVDEFLAYGNVAHESVKLPSWLIRQRWMHHGGSSELTVDSITDTKRRIIMAFQAVCDCVSELMDDGEDAEASSSWFSLPCDKRLRRISNFGVPKAVQCLAYKLDEEIFNQIAAILNKEAVLSTVTTQVRGAVEDDDSYLSPSVESELVFRKQQSVVVSHGSAFPSRPGSSSSPSTAQPAPVLHAVDTVRSQLQLPEALSSVEQRRVSRKRLLSPPCERGRDGGGVNSCARRSSLVSATRANIFNAYEPEPPRRRVRTKPRADNATQNSERRILALLDSSQRDFYQSMHRLRAERIRERRERQSFLLNIVAQRCNPPMDSARAAYLRELTLQQSQQLFVNFVALHSEREHEREQQRRLLRSTLRSRLSTRCHSLDHLQHLEKDKVPDASYERPVHG